MPSLAQIALLLLVAVLLVPLLQRARLGGVLGYLAAGVVVGPFGIGAVSDPQAMLHFAEFGVVLLLFLIGLELEPARLWTLRHPVFGLGGAQLAVSAVLLAGCALLFGLGWQAAVVAGLAGAMSSTALVLASLRERGQLGARHGRDAFAILLFQDLAVIPILAILPLLGGTRSDGGHWTSAAIALGAIALVVAAGRSVVRPVLRFVATNSSRDVFTAAALLLVVGSAALMNSLGISMALGAFLAGVLLADSEFRHELEADIEPFKGLLLGLFFMAVGMSANLSLITSSPGTVLGIAGGLVLVKFVAMWVIARLAGAPGEVSERLAVSLAQGGEFAFVLLTGAASLAIFEPASAELLILAVTVSMLSAPILMLLHDRWMDRRLAAAPARPFDRIEEGANPVIIAGFGRFGQIVARVLRLCDVRFTALDVSSQQVDFVRQFGNLIYYGDASRHELLEAAKTGEAKLFVLAIDDVEASVRTARLVRRHYPKLPVVARARNRVHWYRLRDLGVTTIYRETFSSSLEAAHQALLRVGVGIAAAERAIALFRRHDEEQLLVQYAVHQDEAQLIQTAREAGEQLKELFDADAVGPASLSRREEAKPG